MKNPFRFTVLLSLCFVLSGCYQASVRVRKQPAGPTSTSVDGKLHYSLLGVVELSDEINLEKACPEGAARIEEKVSVFGGVINAVLGTWLPIIQVFNPTVKCVGNERK